eukprot:scaffold86_cov338-Pavlova_lutheri.AAC.10
MIVRNTNSRFYKRYLLSLLSYYYDLSERRATPKRFPPRGKPRIRLGKRQERLRSEGRNACFGTKRQCPLDRA